MTNKEMANLEKELEEKRAINRAYRDGLNDAWECARKIMLSAVDGGFIRDELIDIFGTADYYSILKTYTVSEAMDTIKKYKEGFKVGDEVLDRETNCVAVVTRTSFFDDIYVTYKDGSSGMHANGRYTKTGRHFPQIGEILKEMQEECNEHAEAIRNQ